MGHGKETPRQKMIGMMYLVLTALLALNVSAEVLNAFVLVDQSMRNTTENFVKKNDMVYAKFDAAMQEEETKAKTEKWKKIADEVKASANKLVQHMEDLKDKIVNTAEGKANPYVSSEDRDPGLVQKKSDNNVPGQIMILEGEATELKKKIDAYREELIAIINDNTTEKQKESFKGMINGFKVALNTDDAEDRTGQIKTWEITNFDHLPLSGVLTMLSKFQTDIRNAEAEILGFLVGQIEAVPFKFNKLEAIVVPNSNYVLKGGTYEAEVFIAASDSTTDPTILVGGRKLPIKNGKGIYTGGSGSVGFKSWGGVIEVENQTTGEIKKYPFNAEYQVGEAGVTVSPTKMNVFYIGVDNPVSIAASGVSDDKLRVSMTNGTIRKSGNGYSVRVKRSGKAVISVSAEIDGKVRKMGSSEFRVKRVPDPVAMVAGKEGGVIQKNAIIAVNRVSAVMKNFDFDLRFEVTSFTVSASIGGFEEEARGRGSRLNGKQIALIKKIKPGRKIYFEDIKAKGPDGSIRNLGTVSFKVR